MPVEIVDGYVTPEQIAAYARNASDARADDIAQIVTTVSRAIEAHCGTGEDPRRFLQLGADDDPVTFTFEVRAGTKHIETGDLVSIDTIAGDSGDGTYDVDVGGARHMHPLNSDVMVPPRPFRSIELVSPVPAGVTHIRISGVWGWPAVPAQIERACLIQSARLISRADSPLGIAEGLGEFGGMRLVGGFDKDVALLLEPFTLVRLGFA